MWAGKAHTQERQHWAGLHERTWWQTVSSDLHLTNASPFLLASWLAQASGHNPLLLCSLCTQLGGRGEPTTHLHRRISFHLIAAPVPGYQPRGLGTEAGNFRLSLQLGSWPLGTAHSRERRAPAPWRQGHGWESTSWKTNCGLSRDKLGTHCVLARQ